MEAERWRQIEQLYHAALDLEPVDREAFLAEASENEELRQEVSSLLNQSAWGSSPLDRPAWEGACLTSDFTQTNHWGLDPGTQVGPYRIEAALGLRTPKVVVHGNRAVDAQLIKVGRGMIAGEHERPTNVDRRV